MTDAKAITVSLADQAEETERKRAAMLEEYGRTSLAAAEGNVDASETLLVLERDIADLNADLRRVEAAQVEARAQAAAQACAAEAQSAAERANSARMLVADQVANIERLDAAVAEMRAALLAMRDGNTAIGDALGSEAHQSIHDFNLKLPIMIDT